MNEDSPEFWPMKCTFQRRRPIRLILQGVPLLGGVKQGWCGETKAIFEQMHQNLDKNGYS